MSLNTVWGTLLCSAPCERPLVYGTHLWHFLWCLYCHWNSFFCKTVGELTPPRGDLRPMGDQRLVEAGQTGSLTVFSRQPSWTYAACQVNTPSKICSAPLWRSWTVASMLIHCLKPFLVSFSFYHNFPALYLCLTKHQALVSRRPLTKHCYG